MKIIDHKIIQTTLAQLGQDIKLQQNILINRIYADFIS